MSFFPVLRVHQRIFTASKRDSSSSQDGSEPGQKRKKREPFEYYEILGLTKTARLMDIKQAYFRLATTGH